MSRLQLKLLRDMRASIWQFLAISFVAALGVALFQGCLVAYVNQRDSYQRSYEEMRFADVTVHMKRAPRSALTQVSRIPGVRALEGRIVQDVEVEQDSGRRPRILGRFVTLPADGEPSVNRIRLLRGRNLLPGAIREVLLEAGFAQANRYVPGDRLYPRLGGRRVAFTVAGIVTSAEYIYAMPSEQFTIPMPETFGVMFVRHSQVESLLGMAGSINEIVLITAPGRAQEVGAAIRRRLDAYGTEEPMLQADQPSNEVVQSDLEGFKPFIIVMPALFLGAAAIAFSLVLTRWVQSQRGIIGFLRASGFSGGAVLRHYLGAGLAVGLSGGLAGIGLGVVTTRWLTSLYDTLMHLPYPVRNPHWEMAAIGLALSIASALAGAWGPARRAARMTPAEAMRGQAPSVWGVIQRIRLPLWLALPMRNVIRRPLRSLGTAAGVAVSMVLLVISGFFVDSMDNLIGIFMREIESFDLNVAFVPERSEKIVEHIRRWPGVTAAEATLDIGVRVLRAGREEETVAIGLRGGSGLRNILYSDDSPAVPARGGVLFGRGLADRLRAERGDVIRAEYVQNTDRVYAHASLRAGPLIQQPVGYPIYLRMDDLQRLFASRLGMPPDAATGALIRVHPDYLTSVRRRLHDTEGVALVFTRAELRRQMELLIATSQGMIWAMYIFGIAMALAVTYTATDAVLWERTKELATLRTLGFGMRKLALLASIENLIVGIAGAVAGMPLGYLVAKSLIEAQETESFQMELFVSPNTYMVAVTGLLAVVLLGQLPGLRRIARLDLADATRFREE